MSLFFILWRRIEKGISNLLLVLVEPAFNHFIVFIRMSNLSLRTQALSDNVHHRFLDPITLDLMKDPVIAADNHTYDRESIQLWFQTSKIGGQGIVSPLTSLPMSSEVLRPNDDLKRELLIFITSRESSIQAPDIKFTLSSDIYKELDRISKLSLLEQLDLKPPKIVVIGNESHGKSTLLERIIGLPLFPKDKGLCTRCVIRVHLRRSVVGVPSIAEISVRSTAPFAHPGNTWPDLVNRHDEQPENAAYTVFAALDNIREKIQITMNQVIQDDPQKRLVIDDKEIVVKINLPYCLNIDILDVPGLVTLSPENATQNLPEVTQNLALKIVKEEQESAIFLLVNDIRVPLNQSKGCAIIQQAKVEQQTLGIFTKIDTYVSEDGDETEEIAHLLEGRNPSFFRVGYGWMAASSKKRSGLVDAIQQHAPIELGLLYQMTPTETELFQGKHSRLSAGNTALLLGIDNIRQRVQNLYETFIKTHWIPVISHKLQEHRKQLLKEMNELGALLPRDPAYVPFVEELRSKEVELHFFPEGYLEEVIPALFHFAIQDAEEIWISLSSDTEYWNLVQNLHDSWGSPGGGPFIKYHSRQCFPPPVNGYHQRLSADELAENLFRQQRFSGLVAHFPKIVDASDFFKTREGVERTVRESLGKMFQILKGKLQPCEHNIHCIVYAMCSYTYPDCIKKKSGGPRLVSDFKILRFPSVVNGMNRIVSQKLQQAYEMFDTWYVNFVSTKLASPLLFPEYVKDENKVSCCLHWSDPQTYERVPHLIMEKFYEVLETQFSHLEMKDLIPSAGDFTNLVEDCRHKRLNFLRLISNVVEVEAAIDLFARRVRVLVRDP
jgi:GTP-binding protein EngB required for normal cell division